MYEQLSKSDTTLKKGIRFHRHAVHKIANENPMALCQNRDFKLKHKTSGEGDNLRITHVRPDGNKNQHAPLCHK